MSSSPIRRKSTGGLLSLGILGPLRLWRDGVELDAGPRQQAYLLGLLLARAGRPTSTTELIGLIWDDDAPATAVNILQKYVGALRRLLEPELPVRGTGSYLLRRGGGYLFTGGPDTVDVTTFRDLVDAARTCLAEQRPDVALDRYVQALRLWRGPAGDGLPHGPTAMPVFTTLDDDFFDACVAAASLAVSLGRPERVLQPLRLAAWMAPLHETVQASLVAALGATGRQAEALSVFQAVRARLAEQLGIDPGPALQAAYRDVLNERATPANTVGESSAATSTACSACSGHACCRLAVNLSRPFGPQPNAPGRRPANARPTLFAHRVEKRGSGHCAQTVPNRA